MKKLYKLDAIEIYKMVLNKELKRFPKSFWQRPEAPQNAINCTKYLIEDILQWNDENIKTKLNYQIFKDNKLIAMLDRIYNSSPYNAINTLYPNRFKPWELPQVPLNYWNENTAKEATKWLIEEKLQWNDNDIKEKLNAQIFINNGFGCMLRYIYEESPYKAINHLYPNKFKKEDLKTYLKNGKY